MILGYPFLDKLKIFMKEINIALPKKHIYSMFYILNTQTDMLEKWGKLVPLVKLTIGKIPLRSISNLRSKTQALFLVLFNLWVKSQDLIKTLFMKSLSHLNLLGLLTQQQDKPRVIEKTLWEKWLKIVNQTLLDYYQTFHKILVW
jgi:hypothetical protein